MRESWIIASKLQAPSPPTGWLRRQLLPEGARLPAVTVLEAGPGYGKTLAMLAMSEAESALRVWYTLDAYDADPATVFHYLLAGLRAHIPQFGDELAALLTRPNADPRLLWQVFFGSIAEFNLPALHLVLDDFHHLEETQPELVQALAYHLDKLPAGVKVLLATRKRFPVPLGKLVAKRAALVLEPAQLRFTADEERAFLAERAPDTGVPEAWRKQAANLDGWPLGLDLVTQVADAGSLRWDRPNESLTEFVAEEMYQAQPAALKDLLLKAALLQDITADACRWVFQDLQAAEHLAALEAVHLVMPLADGDGYRMPTYLREYLRQEAVRAVPAIALAEWHRRAAAYYQDKGADELAIPHLIALKDWTAAAVACNIAFPAMGLYGRSAAVRRWLDAFPPEVVKAEPWLHLWWAHVAARRGQRAEAMSAYAETGRAFAARDDWAGAFKVMVRELSMAIFDDDLKRFGTLTLQAQGQLINGRPEDLADFHLARALSAELRGDLGLMKECNEAVLALPTAGNLEVAACQATALQNLFTVSLHQGDLRAAGRFLEQALAIAEAHRFHGYGLYATIMRAYWHLIQGGVEEAGALIRGLPGFWTEVLDFQEEAVAHTVIGQYHQARGDWKEAEAALQKAIGIFEQAGYQEGKRVPYERMLWLALARKQYARVTALYLEAGELSLHSIHDLALVLPFARALHLGGDSAAALAELHRILPELESLGARLYLTRARLFEVACRARLDDREAARALHAELKGLIEAQGYEFLITQDQVLHEELAALAEVPEAHVPAPEALQERSAVVPAAPEAPAAIASAGAAKLQIRVFGGFEIRQDGVLIEQGLRRKGKLILAALALYPRGMPLVEVAELLGATDFTPGNLRTFQADVSEIRRALEPQLAKGKSSQYLKLVDERYFLDAAALEFVDVRAFSQEASTGDRLRESAPVDAAAAYERAMLHYRGNLLDEGSYQKYFEGEREAYRQQAAAVLAWLARFHQQRGDNTGAEEALKRAIQVAPADEDRYMALMRHYEAIGQIERARQIYWDCRKAFKALLSDVPSDEFEAAYRQMLGAPARR